MAIPTRPYQSSDPCPLSLSSSGFPLVMIARSFFDAPGNTTGLTKRYWYCKKQKSKRKENLQQLQFATCFTHPTTTQPLKCPKSVRHPSGFIRRPVFTFLWSYVLRPLDNAVYNHRKQRVFVMLWQDWERNMTRNPGVYPLTKFCWSTSDI